MDRWYRELRVCHPDVFDRYFRLAIPIGDLSQEDLDMVLSLTSNRPALANVFRRFSGDGRLYTLLDRLDSYKEEIDLADAVPFVTALFDVGEALPTSPSGFFSISADLYVYRIIYYYLRKLAMPSDRCHVLKEAMRNTIGLYLPVMLTSLENSRRKQKNDVGQYLIDDEGLNELRAICVNMIRRAAGDNSLAASPYMGYILYRWRDWATPDEPCAWVAKLVSNADGSLTLLRAFLQESTSQQVGSYYLRRRHRIRLSAIEAFVSVDQIEERTRNLRSVDLESEDRVALEALAEALERRRKGIPDDSIDGWSDEQDDM